MPAPTNTFKQAFRDCQLQLGCWLGLADGYATEIASTASFDWLLIDGEHAPNDLRSILVQMQNVQASGAHTMVRLSVGRTFPRFNPTEAFEKTVAARRPNELVPECNFEPIFCVDSDADAGI